MKCNYYLSSLDCCPDDVPPAILKLVWYTKTMTVTEFNRLGLNNAHVDHDIDTIFWWMNSKNSAKDLFGQIENMPEEQHDKYKASLWHDMVEVLVTHF
ncbi:MAG: hypothetical protein Q9164_005396 [Protoblastenia rupestris]